jgi:beta-glucanase (GH16 family)
MSDESETLSKHSREHLLADDVARILVVCFGLGAPSPVLAQSSWQLIWSDEFNRAVNTGVDTGPNGWIYDLGTGYGCVGCPPNWGTGEVETMTDRVENVSHDGAGHLRITPIRDAFGQWTSGRIETRRTDFQPPPGGVLAMEASIQQPNVGGAAAAGYWPAFWALGAPFRGNYLNWPGVGELDIMEDVNGRSSVFAALHCGIPQGGPCNEPVGMSSGEHACAGCQTGFHKYRVELDKSTTPSQIRWYLDDVNYFIVNSNEVDEATWANALNHGFFILLDVAMGGGFPAAFGGGPTPATASGVPMLVDYVRVSTLSFPRDYFTLPPCRVVDTRNLGAPIGGPALQAQETRVFLLSGHCGIPSTAKAVSINLTVTQAAAAGNLRLYPADQTVPTVANINYAAGQTRANNAIVSLDDRGQMAAFAGQASGTVDLIIDITGYLE